MINNGVLTLSQMTNFRLLPNSKSLQTTISNVIKMAESSPNGEKTLWEQFLLFPKCFQKTYSVHT